VQNGRVWDSKNLQCSALEEDRWTKMTKEIEFLFCLFLRLFTAARASDSLFVFFGNGVESERESVSVLSSSRVEHFRIFIRVLFELLVRFTLK